MRKQKKGKQMEEKDMRKEKVKYYIEKKKKKKMNETY